jgi:hypothetical protein
MQKSDFKKIFYNLIKIIFQGEEDYHKGRILSQAEAQAYLEDVLRDLKNDNC